MLDRVNQPASEVRSQVRSWQSQGLSVVFTNGVFDLLHVGHWRCSKRRLLTEIGLWSD